MVDYQDHRVGNETQVWIKLKISEKDVLKDQKQVPVEDHEYDEEEVQIPKNINFRRICHVCNKGFSSGKALGGHMRIHVQAAKKFLSAKKGKRLVHKKRILDLHGQLVDFDNYNNQLPPPTCSICGKNFPSMKSLFGHMRCHPERAWRGIQPPVNKNTTCLSKTASASASGEDLSKSVPGWSVTAKRGRKPIADDKEQLNDAVHHLMLLANGNSLESGLTGDRCYYNKHGIPEELEITNSINSVTSKTEAHEELASHVNEKRRKKVKLRFLGDAISPVSVVNDQNPGIVTPPEKYKCNTREKSFSTHHALGGHRSSHNKFRMVIQNSNVGTMASSMIDPVNEPAASSSKNVNKNFTPIGPSSSQLTSPGEVNGRRILGFDLNELPPHDDVEYFQFFQFN
ncbi:uncharacterized protein LOC107802631 [Nicotiana tabacum]|uniref:Uncharacterized protein LOC107802631 n=2 Tax=Nicotiana TaxID=4085 RepID=A0A1S4AYL2_TOBAC|nr:PREDICTED: uncharacterized protein LOC104243918 [Nicotiana sylvestris]XP_016481644.1 PREDICTED: uncharacterized protein LOC107802631 [Nicotiana tabacum]